LLAGQADLNIGLQCQSRKRERVGLWGFDLRWRSSGNFRIAGREVSLAMRASELAAEVLYTDAQMPTTDWAFLIEKIFHRHLRALHHARQTNRMVAVNQLKDSNSPPIDCSKTRLVILRIAKAWSKQFRRKFTKTNVEPYENERLVVEQSTN
jgi:hypothetical protein